MAARIRNEGNELFQKNLLEQALAKYDEAAQYAPDDHLLLSNRCHVLCRLGRPQDALVDAEAAVKLRPRWGKAHYRRAVSLSALGRLDDALVSFCSCLAADHNPSAVKHEILHSLHKLLTPQSSARGRCHSPSTTTAPPSPCPSPPAAAPYCLGARMHRPAPPPGLLAAPNTASADREESSGDEDSPQVAIRFMPLSCIATAVQGNSRLHTLLDRIFQEVDRIRSTSAAAAAGADSKWGELCVAPERVDQADFDCVLCCRTLWRPVTTPCGHTYCWMCLDRCLDYSYACPLCMTSLAEYLTCAQKNITEFVEGAMRRLLPAQYSARQLTHRQEVSQLLLLSCCERQPQIPVFVCTSSFPGVPCPLFVYEPRYRVMVRQCVEAGTRQFGIAPCLSKEVGAKRYADFGTMLEIRDWVLLGDGCSILTTVGVSRFKVLSRGEKDGYDTAQVEFLQDQQVPPDRYNTMRELHERVRLKGRAWFSTVLPAVQAEIVRTFGSMPAVEEDWLQLADGPAWAWWLLAILPLGQNLQIGILATVNLEKRLRAIEKTLDYIQRVSGPTGEEAGPRRSFLGDQAPGLSPGRRDHHTQEPGASGGAGGGGARQEQRPGFISRRNLQRFNTQMMLHSGQSATGPRLVVEETL